MALLVKTVVRHTFWLIRRPRRLTHQYCFHGLSEVFANLTVFQGLEVGAFEGVLSIASKDEDGARAEALGKAHIAHIWLYSKCQVLVSPTFKCEKDGICGFGSV